MYEVTSHLPHPTLVVLFHPAALLCFSISMSDLTPDVIISELYVEGLLVGNYCSLIQMKFYSFQNQIIGYVLIAALSMLSLSYCIYRF